MSPPPARRRDAVSVTRVTLGASLMVLHLVLDAGAGREAPDWLVLCALVLAVAGAMLATVGRR